MSLWVRAVCQKSIGHVAAEQLAQGIAVRLPRLCSMLSPEILNESERIIECLRIRSPSESGDFRQFNIHYRQQRDIPIRVGRWCDPEMVQEEIDELLEFLVDVDNPAVFPVRELLCTAMEIVVFELKMSQLEDMGWPLAIAAAAWLAEKGEGLVQADGHGWMEPTKDGVLVLLQEEVQA
jgi:hypothetical protein